ncbi:MAG: hypothetical protein ACYTHN_16325 [Planctomycetota bacterium]
MSVTAQVIFYSIVAAFVLFMLLGWILRERVELGKLMKDAVADLPGVRAAWPEEPQWIALRKREELTEVFRDVVRRFQSVDTVSEVLVSAGIHGVLEHPLSVSIRGVEPSKKDPGLEPDSRDLSPGVSVALKTLGRIVRAEGGEYSHSGGLTCSIHFHRARLSAKPTRFVLLPKPKDWEERYRLQLDLLCWSMLRSGVFRFAHEAERVADWASVRRLKSVFCPAVGLCIDPWLFAHLGFHVWACDTAPIAIEVLSRPDLHPQIYGSEAREQWDVDKASSYAGGVNPDAFETMLFLEEKEFVEERGERITFNTEDRRGDFIDVGSIDVIFACNALPREEVSEATRPALVALLESWVRCLNPEGLLFIHVHNAYDVWSEAREYLLTRGLRETSVLPHPGADLKDGSGKGTSPHFQIIGSSG